MQGHQVRRGGAWCPCQISRQLSLCEGRDLPVYKDQRSRDSTVGVLLSAFSPLPGYREAQNSLPVRTRVRRNEGSSLVVLPISCLSSVSVSRDGLPSAISSTDISLSSSSICMTSLALTILTILSIAQTRYSENRRRTRDSRVAGTLLEAELLERILHVCWYIDSSVRLHS